MITAASFGLIVKLPITLSFWACILYPVFNGDISDDAGDLSEKRCMADVRDYSALFLRCIAHYNNKPASAVAGSLIVTPVTLSMQW